MSFTVEMWGIKDYNIFWHFEKYGVDMKNKKDIKKAFVSTLPVLAGYLALGFGFGVLLSTKGYDGKWALFMMLKYRNASCIIGSL
jgi:hypothetical protein